MASIISASNIAPSLQPNNTERRKSQRLAISRHRRIGSICKSEKPNLTVFDNRIQDQKDSGRYYKLSMTCPSTGGIDITGRNVDTRKAPPPKPPARKKGALVTNEMSYKAKKRLHTALAGMMGSHGILSMLTLTFGKKEPTSKEAATMLDSFNKRLARKYGVKVKEYLWVKEPQERGCIHFHYVTPQFVCKDWLNKSWSSIVSKWQSSIGEDQQQVYPNVRSCKGRKGIEYIKGYLVKHKGSLEGNRYSISPTATMAYLRPDRLVVMTTQDEGQQIIEAAGRAMDTLQIWNIRYAGKYSAFEALKIRTDTAIPQDIISSIVSDQDDLSTAIGEFRYRKGKPFKRRRKKPKKMSA